MANFLLNSLFRFAVSILNFVSPSIVADVLLHPFDFATVLLQIGFDPEGVKCQSPTLVCVIVQCALFTFYIPYLLTTMHGLQFMGMSHSSIFYYVNHIYQKEGVTGCYRGLVPKLIERVIMVGVKRRIEKDSCGSSESSGHQSDHTEFLQDLINTMCSQFFAVLASHPFHVLMVSSFAEFTCNKSSNLFELSRDIYIDEGYFGFFAGLTARLLGELLSLMFSVTYTAIINKQFRPQRPVVDVQQSEPEMTPSTTNFVNYVTDMSRFTAFKQSNPKEGDIKLIEDENHATLRSRSRGGRGRVQAVHDDDEDDVDDNEEDDDDYEGGQDGLDVEDDQIDREEDRDRMRWHLPQAYLSAFNLFGNAACVSTWLGRFDLHVRFPRIPAILACIPLTSKLFYYIMIRDFLSKKISTPFFLVSHCAIVLETGWDKFPILSYLESVADLIQLHVLPTKKVRMHMCRPSEFGIPGT